MKKTSSINCTLLSIISSFSLFATDLKVGDQAPNFNLQATTGDY